jgi:hypothetical protein
VFDIQYLSNRVVVGAGRVFVFLVLGSLLMGCHKPIEPQPALKVELELAPQPPRLGPGVITLVVADAEGKAVTGAHVSVEGDMTHAGMGPIIAEAKEVGAGRYQAPFEFSMGGDWVIVVHVTLPSGQAVERQFEVRGVSSN